MLIFCLKSYGQYDIQIEVDNYENDTLLIGYYFGDRQLSRDTILKKDGKFSYEGSDTLETGVYMILYKPNHEFTQFLIGDEAPSFTMKVNFDDLNDVKIKGSKINEKFYSYLQFLRNKREVANKIKEELKGEKEGQELENLNAKLDKIDEEVRAEQRRLVEENPESILALIVRANFETEIPDFEGSEEDVQYQRYLFYKNHYFDHVDFNNKGLIRTSFIHDRIDYYLEKLTVQLPDSLNKSIDTILHYLSPNEEAFRFYLSNIFNRYIAKKIVGMDAIYVHMVDMYYSQGRAPWVSGEQLTKMKSNADNFRNILIGKIMPDFTTYKKDGTPVRLYDINSDYTIVLFWAHDCGHCKKSMPDVINFYNSYKGKADFTLLSICTKGGDKESKCWEYIEEKGMQNFLNTSDKYQRYRRNVYIQSTPKLFILDKEKEIIIKDIPADQLERIMDDVIKSKEEEDNKKE